MEITPQIFTAKVMHQRHFPKVNRFTYAVYYLALPLAKLRELTIFPINRRGVLNLREADYGARDGSALAPWVEGVLAQYQLTDKVQHVMFITMPRILGYGFNPVSFYLCFDAEKQLRAVINEVHNTFNETHSYLTAHQDRRPIHKDDWLTAEKIFHVSPFLEREGSYRFRFAQEEGKLGIWIDYLNAEGKTQLITSLVGKLQPLTRASLWKVFFTHPLITLKTIMLIHWQALKLVAKGISYISKPTQKDQRLSASPDL